jgi:DNA polymerase-1
VQTQQTPVLLLVDGHSLAYRAFFALPPENFSTSSGLTTNAVYGFTSMLINVLRDEKPTHAAVAFDVSRRTFRTEMFPEYKANRTKSPEEFTAQIPFIHDVLRALKLPDLQVEGFEADDIIATLTAKARAEGLDVLILTGDRDAFQLVDDHVTVLYARRGVSDLARMTPAAVLEKYELEPKQYPDFAALRGDPSDNLPSVPSVGEKTATKWIKEYGSLEALLEHADEVKGKVGEALRAHIDQVRTNRELTELVRDVPLQQVPEDLERVPFERSEVHEVFDALEFRILRDRLFDEHRDDVAGGPATPATTVTKVALGQLGAALESKRALLTGVALQGTWGRGTGEEQRIAFAWGADDAIVVDPAELGAADHNALREFLGDAETPKVLHDAKGPMHALRASGLPLAGLAGDTALTSYLVLPSQRALDLIDLAARYLGRDLSATPGASAQLALLADTESDDAELAAQALAVHDLTEPFAAEVEAAGGTALLHEVELPLVSVLAEMEEDGIAVDLDHLRQLDDEFGARANGIEREAHDAVGRPFNLGSPKQLQEILFDERGLPHGKKTKTGYTTDAETLTTLVLQRPDDPLPAMLLAWRDVTKLRQTVNGLIPLADAHSRIHTTFNQLVASTGRLSSQDPNLQNIPTRTEEGRRIRAGFVAGEGFDTLLTADYSQIEMRVMAHLSKDAGLIAAFRAGEDLHTTVASQVFGVAAEDVDAELRRRVKAVSYGLAYGLSSFGLSQGLGIGVDEASRLMDTYFERFGGVRDYLKSVVEQARTDGYTETLLGRRRFLPDLNSDNRQRRDMAERMALNAPIQGSAADIMKVAMLRVVEHLRGQGLRSRLLLQVHDELVLEVAPGELEAVEALVRDAMGTAYPLDVPLDVSVGIGRTWQDAGH